MPPKSSWYSAAPPADPLSQGDIILDCPVAGWATGPVELGDDLAVGEELLARVELVSADLIVMTQACDLEQSHVEDVILCPHQRLENYQAAWEAEMRSKAQSPTTRSWRRHCDDIRDGFVWNMVFLNAGQADGVQTEHRVVDFHYIYTVPRVFVESLVRLRNVPRLRLTSPYLENVSQSFARYFMRVGLPTPVARVWS